MHPKTILIIFLIISYQNSHESSIDGNINFSTELDNIKNELETLQNILNDLKSIKQQDLVKEETESISMNQTCLTKECIESSFNLLSNIDFSVDPCEDFYKFSCGEYMKKAIITEDKVRITAITPLRDISILKVF